MTTGQPRSRAPVHTQTVPGERHETYETYEGYENHETHETHEGYEAAQAKLANGQQTARQPRPQAPQARTSVIVTARNYATFLPQCLHSLLTQTLKPLEIIYFDDGSQDNSLAVARQFEPFGVRIVSAQHQGVIAARNRAASLATGETLLFVDGDNMLPPDFLAKQTASLTDGIGFAYPAKQFFGHSTHLWHPPEYDRSELWMQNYIDTCSLVRHELFTAAGGWQDNAADTQWDWDLWLRVGRFAPGAKSPTELYYRYHDDNWSNAPRVRRPERRTDAKGIIRRAAARLAICCPFSGRLPDLFPEWLDCVIAASRGLGRELPELFILDDSPQGFWTIAGSHLRSLSEAFSGIQVKHVHQGVTANIRRKDRVATARFLSALFNRFLNECAADVLWFIEDDIIVPESSGRQLYHLLLDGDQPRAAVTGLYRSRHEECYVAATVGNRTVNHISERPSIPTEYDLVGTGCLMVFRPLAQADFAPASDIFEERMSIHAHDWVYSWRLKKLGYPITAHPDVLCRHHLTETDWR